MVRYMQFRLVEYSDEMMVDFNNYIQYAHKLYTPHENFMLINNIIIYKYFVKSAMLISIEF